MMQDVLVQRRKVEAIRHAQVPTEKTPDEWRSGDELA